MHEHEQSDEEEVRDCETEGLPGTYYQTPQCHLVNVKRPRLRGLPDQMYCTVRQKVWVGEVETVWGTPISQEAKEWVSWRLEKKLLKNHNGRLTQSAAVEVTKRDKTVERYVEKKGLQMRAADVAWAWVAHKAHRGQTVGQVFRPELGKLAQHEEQVLWQLVAMATTGWDTEVGERVTRETLWRVVLSRQVLKSVYRVTDRDRTVQNGVSVEQLQDMDLEPVMMTKRLAAMAMVWQNMNKLAGLTQGGGAGRARFWAYMHMLMQEGPIEGSAGRHHHDRSWDGMAEEVRRLKALRTGKHPPQGPLRGNLGDSPDDSKAEVDDGGRDNAAAPGTGAEAGAGQLMILGGPGLKEEEGGADAAGQGGTDGEWGDSTEEEELLSLEGEEKVTQEWLELQEEQDQEWLEGQREAAAQEQRRSSCQEGADTGGRDRRGGVSVECQA